MNDFARKVNENQERITRDLRGLIADAEELLRHAVHDASSEFTQARERLEQRLVAARSRLAAAEEAVLAKVGDTARATDDYVHRNAWTAIGVGATVGVLAGLLLTRR